MKPRGDANFLASLSICCANSRVGAIISAYGPRCLISSVNGGKFEIKASIGMTKAAVLPEPYRKVHLSVNALHDVRVAYLFQQCQ